MASAHLYRRLVLTALFLGFAIVAWLLLSRAVPAPEPGPSVGVLPSHAAVAPRTPAGNIVDVQSPAVPGPSPAGSNNMQPAAPAVGAGPHTESGSAGPMDIAAAESTDAARNAIRDTDSGIPRDWSMCFGQPGDEAYLFASDSGSAWSGSFSARIGLRENRSATSGAGICQTISADTFKGRRVELSMHLRTRAASPGAHMLFRADAADGRVVAFYNMEPRWISGTSGWKRYLVVIDVPESAAAIVVGASLVRAGELWIDDVALEVVGTDRQLTRPPLALAQYNIPPPVQLPHQLKNAGFEDTTSSAPGD